MLLSASIRKVACVTTRSPAFTPSSTCTQPGTRAPSLTGPRLVAALAALDQHDLAPAAVDHRRVRHGKATAVERRGDLDGGRHVGAQPAVGVGDLDAQPRRAAFLADVG